MLFLKVENSFLMISRGIIPIKAKTARKGEGLKILTPKQILRRLPIALAQAKAGNTS